MSKNLYLLMFVALLELSLAQRPSFAGSRPPGGLSQRDKYNAPQNTAVENITGVDIGSRFGDDAVPQRTPLINLAFGAPQRPPVGVPLVLPISSYTPDVAPAFATSTTAPVLLVNRFGGNDNSASLPLPSTVASFPSSVASFPSQSTVSSPSSGTNWPMPGSSVSLRPSASAGGNTPIPNALPIDAHGDREYVNYLSTLPLDHQPFWFINYQAIESQRNSTRPNIGAFETRGSSFAG